MLEVSHLTLTLSESSAKTPLVRDVSFVVRPMKRMPSWESLDAESP